MHAVPTGCLNYAVAQWTAQTPNGQHRFFADEDRHDGLARLALTCRWPSRWPTCRASRNSATSFFLGPSAAAAPVLQLKSAYGRTRALRPGKLHMNMAVAHEWSCFALDKTDDMPARSSPRTGSSKVADSAQHVATAASAHLRNCRTAPAATVRASMAIWCTISTAKGRNTPSVNITCFQNSSRVSGSRHRDAIIKHLTT
jgi:hypothetical protein